jgi:hypothetical protein
VQGAGSFGDARGGGHDQLDQGGITDCGQLADRAVEQDRSGQREPFEHDLVQ